MRKSTSARNKKRTRQLRTLALERFEDRVALSVTGISNFDQLLVELINRARANPQAEANRYGVELNQGLAAGTISTAAKEPLAPQQALMNAAGLYSNDMLARNFFSHTDPDGTLPWDRTEAQGYPSFAGVGENIAWGTFVGSQEQAVHDRHRNLFLSPGHRENMLSPSWIEIGTGVTLGKSPYQGVTFPNVDVSLVTENFGGRSGITYLTGVAFNDAVDNDAFDISEGLGGVTVTATSGGSVFTTTTATSGGYALQLPAGTYTVTATGNGVNTTRSGVVIGSDSVKIDFLPSPPPAVPAGTAIGETGQVTVTQSSATLWHRVNLSRTYSNPVVVFGPLTFFGGDPALVRVRNVTANSFEWQLDEWDYLDGIHPASETVGYLVVEAGTHTLSGGSALAAGAVATDHQFKSVTYSGFSSAPALFATVSSVVGGSTITTRIRNATSTGFEIRLQEEERNDDRHSVESIGYVAIQKGSGQIGPLDFIAGATGNNVTNVGATIQFGSRFSASPVLLGNIQTYFGAEPVVLRTSNLTAASVNVFAQEDQSLDTEVVHPAEDVAFLAIETGTILATASTAPPSNRAPNIENQTFSVANNAVNGSTVGNVVATDPDSGDLISYSITGGNTNNAFSIDGPSGRLTVADQTRLNISQFQLTVQARDSRGATDSATITVNVTAPTTFAVGEAGTVTAAQTNSNQWHRVQLQRAYRDPIVVVGPLSYNGTNASNVRVRNVVSSSFEWQIDEWDYLDGGHSSESAGYLVIEAGTHVLATGTRIVAGKTYSDHRFAPVSLPNLTGVPVVLATAATVNGGTAVVPRIQNASGTGFEIRVQEEQASDGLHSIETMDYIAIEQASGTTSSKRFMSSLTGVSVFHSEFSVSIGTNFTSTPVFLANVQTFLGADPTGMRRTFLDRSGARFFLEEEQSGDVEVEHASEAVGFFAIDAGLIDSDASSLGIHRAERSLVGSAIESPRGDTSGDLRRAANVVLNLRRRSRAFDNFFQNMKGHRSDPSFSKVPSVEDIDRAFNESDIHDPHLI